MEERSDIQYFNHLFTNYKQRFIHFARTYVDDEVTAEDIVTDSLMYYWENRKELESDSNIPAYILTTVKHKCLDYLRQLRVREEYIEYTKSHEARKLTIRIATLEACNPDIIFLAEVQDLIDKTLDTLPTQTREIFTRSRYNNQSHKEIAELFGLSTKTIEFHITKSLKLLRVALKDYLPLFL